MELFYHPSVPCKFSEFFKNIWYNAEGKKIIDQCTTQDLIKSLSANKPWRNPNSAGAYFPVSDFKAVVAAEFKAKPTKPTLTKFNSNVERCRKNSSNAYLANHDVLTGLLNKAGLDNEFATLFGGSELPHSQESELVDYAQTQVWIGLLALDLDHFKQINDTFGHNYGDIVLNSFSRRLEKTVREILAIVNDRATLAIARPSGEEFNCLIVGTLSKDELITVANTICTAISNTPLPNDDEWNAQIEDGALTSIEMPPTNSRRLTVSIGIAATTYVTARRDPNEAFLDLKLRADTALYKAKSCGRNIAIHFDDILNKYGRVLEHHREANVVAIDIGRSVNVVPGQDFLVYHPDFTGNREFLHTDGRTTKSLGAYPRYSYGRIEAFQVDNEISFCRIIKTEENVAFPEGSELEAVHAGSIGNLIAFESQTAGAFAGSGLLTADKIPGIVTEIVKENKMPVTAVFTMKNIVSLTNDRGIAFINQSLEKLYKVIWEVFPSSTRIGQTQRYEFGVVNEVSEVSNIVDLVEEVLERARDSCSGIVNFVAGVFKPAEAETPDSETAESKLDMTKALDFARYAVSEEGRAEESKIEIFSVDTAERIVRRQRAKGKYDQAMQDYKDFKALGLVSAYLENHAALIALRVGDFDLAFSTVKLATELDPSIFIFRANFGLIEFYRGNKSASYNHFARSLEIQPHRKFPDNYLGVFALAMFHKYKENDAEIEGEMVRLALEKGLKVPEGELLFVGYEELKSALQQV